MMQQFQKLGLISVYRLQTYKIPLPIYHSFYGFAATTKLTTKHGMNPKFTEISLKFKS